MVTIHDADGNLIEVQLDPGEQLLLMKENIKLLKQGKVINKGNDKEKQVQK